MVLFSLDQIDNSKVLRLSTGYSYLDRAFGVTTHGNVESYGMPCGRIVFASGEPGVGKTRFGISITKKVNARGGKVLVFQGEVRPQEFKQWTGSNVVNPSRFFVSDDREIVKIIEYIRQEKPMLVIIDSANMIEDYNKSSEIRIILDSLKDAVAEVGCVCFMIGHLTKDGKMKGNADVAHLVDVECSIKKFKPYTKQIVNELPLLEDFRLRYTHVDGMFRFGIGKNRYGASGGWAVFHHLDSGIEFVDSSFGVNQEVFGGFVENITGRVKPQGTGFLAWLRR